MRQLKDVSVNKLFENPDLIRPVDKEDLAYIDLVESVKQDGIINPIIVRAHKDKKGSYEIVTGLKRYNAALDAGLDKIPVLVMDLDDDEALKLKIIEAAHQGSPIKRTEFSLALLKLLDANPDLTVKELAKMLSKSDDWIYDQLGLNKLIPKAKELVNKGEINLSNAYALSKLPEFEQEKFIDKAMTMATAEFAGEVAARMKELKLASKKER